MNKGLVPNLFLYFVCVSITNNNNNNSYRVIRYLNIILQFNQLQVIDRTGVIRNDYVFFGFSRSLNQSTLSI